MYYSGQTCKNQHVCGKVNSVGRIIEMSIRDNVRKMKEVSPVVASLDVRIRDAALRAVAASLTSRKEEIFAANREDLARADRDGIADSVRKRLRFDEHKLSDCLAGIDSLLALEDPAGRITLKRELDEGLVLERVTVPIGVIGIIFEARPDALVQISCLCIKSGNCAVLKGGKETASTNKVLFELIRDAACSAGIPEGSLLQASAHSEIDELLECDDCVDLLIPRGSNAFVRYIMDHTRIPVMGHADGLCHIYVDKAADQEKALRIIVDAKTQYTAACNAVETLLIHKDIAGEFVPKLAETLKEEHVVLRGTRDITDLAGGETIGIGDFREYLDLIVSAAVVNDEDEAIRHINTYGSHHTDAIITEDPKAAERFMQLVDSAGVYQNCSTRFADGFRYGFGAEVGISTSKLHARGPVGLDGLVTYKYRLYGEGQIVGDYASGKSEFHFRDN